MTKLPDEAPTGSPVRLGDEPTPNDAVVELIEETIRRSYGADKTIPETAVDILSALSDAGLAVLSKKCTDEMRELGAEQAEQIQNDLAEYVAGETPDWDFEMVAEAIWDVMVAAAFHPSQLEKTDED